MQINTIFWLLQYQKNTVMPKQGLGVTRYLLNFENRLYVLSIKQGFLGLHQRDLCIWSQRPRYHWRSPVRTVLKLTTRNRKHSDMLTRRRWWPRWHSRVIRAGGSWFHFHLGGALPRRECVRRRFPRLLTFDLRAVLCVSALPSIHKGEKYQRHEDHSPENGAYDGDDEIWRRGCVRRIATCNGRCRCRGSRSGTGTGSCCCCFCCYRCGAADSCEG